MGVVVRKYIDNFIIINTFPYSTCINKCVHLMHAKLFSVQNVPIVQSYCLKGSSFLAAASLLLCSFLNCFFSFLFMLFLCNIASVAQRTSKIVQKLRSWEYN